MSRAEVLTNKLIKSDQLKGELGGVDIFTSEGIVQAEGVTKKQLEDAVAAHAPDPMFGASDDEKLLEAFSKNPNPTAQQTAAAVKAMYRSRR